MKQLIIMIVAFVICSCAITNETSLVVGKIRPEIQPEQVKIYIEPPLNYEVISIITADAAHDFMSKQALQDISIKNLKIQAAKVGANGILLDNIGSFNIGSSGIITIPTTTPGAPAIGTAAMNNRTGKQASGKAIYVVGE